MNKKEKTRSTMIEIIQTTKRSPFALLLTMVFLVSMFLFPTTSKSQDLDFSQYYNNPTYYNPAYVGLTMGLKSRLNYRRQWTGLSGDYHSYSFSADIAERSLPGAGGIGIIANQSLAGKGVLKTNTIGIMPSVRIPISKNAIFQLGALASVVTQQLNWDNLVFSDQLDPRWGNIYPTNFPGAARDKVSFPDFSFGGIFQFKPSDDLDGTIGAAVHHLTTPNQSFFEVDAKLPRKYVYNLDFIITIREDQGYYSKRQGFKLNPGMMVQHQSSMLLYTMGMNIYMSNVYLGLWYRNQTLEYDEFSTFTAMAGLNIPFNEQWRMKVMYSYEMNINSNQNFTGPSHEISLIFEFDDIGLIQKRSGGFMAPSSKRSNSPIECSPF
ncbi:MAG: type IX secretion system membrane protein PorP/SprF [Bacteroidales bacterium]|nr:type IX secretion system membrane protein PorP/SprF [Bacteroidales bacterium]